MQLWNLPSGELAGTISRGGERIDPIAFTAGGLIAGTCDDGHLRLWQAPSGASVATLDGNLTFAWTITTARRGQLLITGGSTALCDRYLDLAGESPSIGDLLLAALDRHHAEGDMLVSSSLAWIEVARALRSLYRGTFAEVAADVDAAMSGVVEYPLVAEVVALARRVNPAALRSVDAIQALLGAAAGRRDRADLRPAPRERRYVTPSYLMINTPDVGPRGSMTRSPRSAHGATRRPGTSPNESWSSTHATAIRSPT